MIAKAILNQELNSYAHSLDADLVTRKKLKKPFIDAGHIVQNVEDMGWRGVKDKELLALADRYPFDVFISSDEIRHIRKFSRYYTPSFGVRNSPFSTRPDYLLPLIIQVSEFLESLAPSSYVNIR